MSIRNSTDEQAIIQLLTDLRSRYRLNVELMKASGVDRAIVLIKEYYRGQDTRDQPDAARKTDKPIL